MKKLLVALAAVALSAAAFAQEKTTVNCLDMAVKVYQKALTFPDSYMMGTYRGSCLLHAIADLAVETGDQKVMDDAIDLIKRTDSGDIKFKGNFYSYLNGGSATSLLYWAGRKDLKDIAEKGAARAWKDQTRTYDGMITSNHVKKTPNRHFIDVVFCTTPYFLYEGLAEKNQEYVDLAAYEAVQTLKVLYDAESGLEHQGRGWPDPATKDISKDCWSRGNGWGSMSLQALMRDLPKSNKYYKEMRKIAKNFYEACIKWQDPKTGLWHQEMTDSTSYIETSGSGLLLAGLGQAIQSGVVSKKYKANFIKGLKGLMTYVDPDGSVGHTCQGCLCPGKAEKHDYVIRRYYYNEAHSFGPVVFALAQAIRMGIKDIELDQPLGVANDPERPRTYVKFVSERKEDVAWENDLAAYRVYSRLIPNINASGIDYWGKSRDYSIIDKWYAMNNAGENYHVDRGEGADFYVVGVNPNRGVGGTGVWVDGQLYAAQDYANYRILKNDGKRLEFILYYQPYKAGERTIYESKKIEMVLGTPLFKVTATFEAADGKDLTVATGITVDTKDAKVSERKDGVVVVFETAQKDIPEFYTGVVADPSKVSGTVKNGPDQLVLMNVKSGEPVVYFAGATNANMYLCGKSFWTDLAANGSFAAMQKVYE